MTQFEDMINKDRIIETIARGCHLMNRACCEAFDDPHQSWNSASESARESTIANVRLILDHPCATPEDIHNRWWEHKVRDGWTYGVNQDDSLKQHPCCVPYENLPATEKLKDCVFMAAVIIQAPLLQKIQTLQQREKLKPSPLR